MRDAALLLAVWLGAAGAASGQAMLDELRPSGGVEGRPGGRSASPLQRLIDEARDGDRIVIEPGTYHGDLVIDKTVQLVGRRDGGRLGVRLVGAGAGSVVRVRAPGVTFEAIEVDGRGGGDLAADPSGIHIAARAVTVRDCVVRNSLFGIYLREADGSEIRGCRVVGMPGLEAGDKGSGIHVWNTQGFRIEGNVVSDARDGIYIQSSPGGFIANNHVFDVRYGLHYMLSDDNRFENNVFERSAAGAALMYSRGLTFRGNQFLRSRGFSAVGLLLQQCDRVVAEANLIADNGRGLFVEGVKGARFRGNLIARSDVAIVLYGSAQGLSFTGNAFTANRSPLLLVAGRTDAEFAGNYWDDHRVPDLDGDGRADAPYELSSVFDHFRGNLTAADLYVDGLAAGALAAAEKVLPVLQPVRVFDTAPLASPPDLSAVPRPSRPARVSGLGVACAGVLLMAGAALVRPARARLRRPAERAVHAGPTGRRA